MIHADLEKDPIVGFIHTKYTVNTMSRFELCIVDRHGKKILIELIRNGKVQKIRNDSFEENSAVYFKAILVAFLFKSSIFWKDRKASERALRPCVGLKEEPTGFGVS